jgi:hypothetical protein
MARPPSGEGRTPAGAAGQSPQAVSGRRSTGRQTPDVPTVGAPLFSGVPKSARPKPFTPCDAHALPVTVAHACRARLVAQRLWWPAVADRARGRAQRQPEADAARQDALSSHGLLRDADLPLPEAGFQASRGDQVADRAIARGLAISASLPAARGCPGRVWYIFDSGQVSGLAAGGIALVGSGLCIARAALFRASLGRTGGRQRCPAVRAALRAHLRGDCVDHAPVASPARSRAQPGSAPGAAPEVLGGRPRPSRPCSWRGWPAPCRGCSVEGTFRGPGMAPCRGCWVEGRFGGRPAGAFDAAPCAARGGTSPSRPRSPGPSAWGGGTFRAGWTAFGVARARADSREISRARSRLRISSARTSIAPGGCGAGKHSGPHALSASRTRMVWSRQVVSTVPRLADL